MINSLSPKDSDLAATSSDIRTAPTDEKNDSETPESENWSTPRPEWKRGDYENAYLIASIRKEADRAATINQAYLETSDAKNDDNTNSWEAFVEIMLLNYEKGGSLVRLEALANASPESFGILVCLARAYEKYEDYAKAARTYKLAASKAPDGAKSFEQLGRAAEASVRADLPEIALEAIGQMKNQVKENKIEEIQLLQILSRLAELDKKPVIGLTIMERIVEVDPSNIGMRFSLAYEYSKIKNNDLALLHYLKIPKQVRNSKTWNNLGTAFDGGSLNSKSIDAYRRAKKMGETLAMSNLALKYMSAGLLDEAQQKCDEALKIENYHNNIPHTLARLKDFPGEEDKKLDALLEKSKPKREFYRRFGRAVSQPDLTEITKRWEGPDCDIEVAFSGEVFSAVGSYKRPSIASLIPPGFLAGNNQDHYRVEYKGTQYGRAIEAFVTRVEVGKESTKTLATSLADEVKVLMFLTDDDAEIKVMEIPSKSDPKFHSLQRPQDSA